MKNPLIKNIDLLITVFNSNHTLFVGIYGKIIVAVQYKINMNEEDLMQNVDKITIVLAEQHTENDFEKYRLI